MLSTETHGDLPRKITVLWVGKEIVLICLRIRIRKTLHDLFVSLATSDVEGKSRERMLVEAYI